MKEIQEYDVIVTGGSYAGLSAAMALGRSLRKVLVIDSGRPCNRQTPHSHNFLTQDGKAPAEIARVAREQVQKYPTVSFLEGFADQGRKTGSGFEIQTAAGETFAAKKLIFASGIRDILPDIEGLVACWGITVIHCPYCHGYEVRGEKTGILGNGDYGYEFSKMIQHWTRDLSLFTNGTSSLTAEQSAELQAHGIRIIEKEIDSLRHENGHLQAILFKDGSHEELKALYARADFEQSCPIPLALGCELDETGYLRVDPMQSTSVPGIYACGDNTTPMRAVSNAVAQGTFAGAVLNKELIGEEFEAKVAASKKESTSQ